MRRETSRNRRIAEQIQKILAGLIQLELIDPRVGFITLTGVELSPDYSHAKVFFTLLNTTEKLDATLVGLKQATPFLRRELSHRCALRTVPELHFVYDVSVERGRYLSQLIDAAICPGGSIPAKMVKTRRKRPT
jgi:ribosome-binding factor A